MLRRGYFRNYSTLLLFDYVIDIQIKMNFHSFFDYTIYLSSYYCMTNKLSLLDLKNSLHSASSKFRKYLLNGILPM